MLRWLRRQAEELFGRSGAWKTVRRIHLEREPACAACGRSGDLEVHHIKPYSQHPELELDDGTNGFDGNLITLCSDPCHLVHGHLMSFNRSNSIVREHCRRYRAMLEDAKRLSADTGEE